MGYGFFISILGKYARELVVLGAIVYSRLLGSPGILNLNILDCLGHIAEIGDA